MAKTRVNGKKKKKKGKKKAKAVHVDPQIFSRLIEALRRGEVAEVLAVLESGDYVDAADANGITPLDYAAFTGNVAMVGLLIEHKASIDKTANDGSTPLHTACQNGHDASAKLLIEHKASIGKATNNRFTPLYAACQNGHDASVELLVEHKASIDKATNEGATPLYIACQNDRVAVAGLLIEHKASIDKAKNDGATPLIVACQNGHDTSVELLVEHKASIDKAANNGATPLQTACENGHDESVKLLIEHKASIDKAGSSGYTPLHIACQNGHDASVELLIEHKASVDKATNKGSTPVLIACQNDHTAPSGSKAVSSDSEKEPAIKPRVYIFDWDETLSVMHMYSELEHPEAAAVEQIKKEDPIFVRNILGGKDRIDLLDELFEAIRSSGAQIMICSFGYVDAIYEVLSKTGLLQHVSRVYGQHEEKPDDMSLVPEKCKITPEIQTEERAAFAPEVKVEVVDSVIQEIKKQASDTPGQRIPHSAVVFVDDSSKNCDAVQMECGCDCMTMEIIDDADDYGADAGMKGEHFRQLNKWAVAGVTPSEIESNLLEMITPREEGAKNIHTFLERQDRRQPGDEYLKSRAANMEREVQRLRQLVAGLGDGA